MVSVSASFPRPGGVSEQRRLRRAPGGVCSLGLHLVWWSKCRRRILGGRVAATCGELLEQNAVELGQKFRHLRGCGKVLWPPWYLATSVGYVSESTVSGYIERQWDTVA